MKNTAVIIVSILLQSQPNLSTNLDVLRCATEGLLYSPQANSDCLIPLSQSFCSESQMVVLDLDGQSYCKDQRCPEDEVWYNDSCQPVYGRNGCHEPKKRLYYNLTGGGECECEEGWGRLSGTSDPSCYQISSAGPCQNGHILVKAGADLPCDEPDHVCVSLLDCPSFLRAAKQLSKLEGSEEYISELNILKELVCHYGDKRVCCSQLEAVGNLDIAMLERLITGNSRAGLECKINPCETPNKLPWYNREGCFTSYIPTGSNCTHSLNETINAVECAIDVSLRGVATAYTARCGNGKIYSKYRRKCVKKFFG